MVAKTTRSPKTSRTANSAARDLLTFSSVSSAELSITERQECLENLKMFLSGPLGFFSFEFHLENDVVARSPNAGLEGFLYTLHELERRYGRPPLLAELPYYISYSADLLRITEWDASSIDILKEYLGPSDSLYELFVSTLEVMLKNARAALEQLDKSAWIRSSAIYQVYMRAFNLQGLREARGIKTQCSGSIFKDLEPEDLPAPFSAIRWTGAYPIGQVDMKGIGSPFSIRHHSLVDGTYGTEEQVRGCLKRLEDAGIRSIFELSPNHTSVDSDLLEKDPSVYIHDTTKPSDQTGYYEYHHPVSKKKYWIRRGGYMYDNTRYFWNDTLQLDISNPATCDAMVDTINNLVSRYGVHGFRVDMAYQLLNEPFRANWGNEIAYQMGDQVEDEFFYKMISRVKAKHPEVAFIAEGFYRWERLSAVGFDLVYSKNEMTLEGGYFHYGWYNALSSRNPWLINRAIERAAFLTWQKGGATMLSFVGHHDLPAPQRVFQDWVWGAAFLTLNLPTARNWYAGTEAGFEVPCPENEKMITFLKEVKIDWTGLKRDWGAFVEKTVSQAKEIHSRISNPIVQPIASDDNQPWVGYLIRSCNYPGDKTQGLVVANLSEQHLRFVIHRPELGLHNLAINLAPCGRDGQTLIEL